MLEAVDVKQRLTLVHQALLREQEVLELGNKIESQVKDEVGKTQREYYLREQLKAIQKELGETDENTKEIEELRQKLEDAGMPEEAKKEALREVNRLAKIPPASAEYTVGRTYLDWIVRVPWSKRTEDVYDIPKAKEILDADHYDLEKVKDRILEFLAVRKMKPDIKGPILCFMGPPGVGKTSLGKSIAKALGRKFAPHQPRRDSRRGGDPGSPENLYRGTPRADHPEPLPRRVQKPGVHFGRDRQARNGLPGRSELGVA